MSKLVKGLKLAALGVAATLALESAAHADVVDCIPERARATADRIDARCQGINRWFIAMRSNTDAQALNQMLSLLNSAIVAGKTVKLYYSLDVDGNGILWAVEIFK